MRIAVVDIETDGLLDEFTKVHVVSYYEIGSKEVHSLYDNFSVLNMFDVVVGHNFSQFDIFVLERYFKPTFEVWDTIALCQAVLPNLGSYSLDNVSKALGFDKKIDVDDWVDGDRELYTERCELDVKINANIFVHIYNQLIGMYGDAESAEKYIRYVSSLFNSYTLYKKSNLKLDVALCASNIVDLSSELNNKYDEFRALMPPAKKKYRKATKPKKMYKKDGTLTSYGEKWVEILQENNLPEDYEGEVQLYRYEDPNPNSVNQIKDWLFSIGWKPCTHKESITTDGSVNRVPQITNGSELTESVKVLTEQHPEIALYEGIGQAKHRLGVLEGLMSSVSDDGSIYSDLHGITNTLRIRHKTLVNLVGVDKPYGKYIRPTIIAPEGSYLCGADLSSLENLIKLHFIKPIDPAFVDKVLTDDYDAHIDLALANNAITVEEAELYKSLKKDEEVFGKQIPDKYKDDYKRIHKIRSIYKTGNYSIQYGVGASKLSKSCGISRREANSLIDSYKKVNQGQYVFASRCDTMEHHGVKWVKNPLNGFWYELRSQKDIFSTIVQGTAAYVFNVWKWYCISSGVDVAFEAHDEILAVCQDKDVTRDKIQRAMDRTNNRLKLNVELTCGIKFGHDYGSVH